MYWHLFTLVKCEDESESESSSTLVRGRKVDKSEVVTPSPRCYHSSYLAPICMSSLQTQFHHALPGDELHFYGPSRSMNHLVKPESQPRGVPSHPSMCRISSPNSRKLLAIVKFDICQSIPQISAGICRSTCPRPSKTFCEFPT